MAPPQQLKNAKGAEVYSEGALMLSVPVPGRGGGHTFMLGMTRRKRNTISVFTSRVMSHSDRGPYCSGCLGRHRSHVRGSGGAEGLGDEAAGVSRQQQALYGHQAGKAPRRWGAEPGHTLLTPHAQAAIATATATPPTPATTTATTTYLPAQPGPHLPEQPHSIKAEIVFTTQDPDLSSSVPEELMGSLF